jgi:hypothetical protein
MLAKVGGYLIHGRAERSECSRIVWHRLGNTGLFAVNTSSSQPGRDSGVGCGAFWRLEQKRGVHGLVRTRREDVRRRDGDGEWGLSRRRDY